ncbi:hypothetical protein SLEP1_g37183 [Rubroshorea leprosula]|uniref:Uncharacterized protein n=1 Tax=Rubroshorea leprosula TaxID=152421 RepID=A0AAV5KUD1_9ROSI|nr:hypothetical protein SLEP1_g37183 [Rubroshorea leprosula]
MSNVLKRQCERAQHSRGCRGGSSQRSTCFDERPLVVPSRNSSQRERGSSSTSRSRTEHKVDTQPSDSRRGAHDDSDAKEDIALIRRRTSSRTQPIQPTVMWSSNIPNPPTCDATEVFSYAVALFEYEQGVRGQNHELNESCKKLTSKKASLEDEVNRLQSFEMANRATSAESRADELANKVNELKEKLEKAQAERDSGIQVAKDKADCAKDRAKNAEADRDKALSELNSLKQRVAKTNRNLVRVEAALDRTKKSHQCSVFASTNTTMEIYNEICGKVLRHQPDFQIGEVAFFEGEEMDKQGKSLAPLVDTMV